MKCLSDRAQFDIRIWFVVVSLVVIVVINVMLALALNSYVSDRIVHREGQVAQEFLNSIINAEGSGEALFQTSEPGPALKSFSNHVRNLPGMVRANIYSLDGFIRYSTEINLIGLKFESNPELTESLNGKLISELKKVSDDDKPEHLALNRLNGEELMESYIPISDAKGRVVTVVEFYKEPLVVKEIISEITRIIWISATLGGLILFLALYGAVARGARIIDDQKREIGGMAALAALGQMASAVAHSLRNPLANIRSTTELLQHEHPELTSEAVHDIYGEVDRMNRHVQELLEYSRSDKVPLQTVNLSETLRSSIGNMSEGLKRRSIDLEIVTDAATAQLVEIDIVMFNHAISNIISNAVEAMPNGGTIGISVDEVVGKGRVAVKISDTGKGISKELLERLPEPFLTSKSRGLGLGLSLARRVLERFGGSLELRSEEGHGTTVILEIPKAD